MSENTASENTAEPKPEVRDYAAELDAAKHDCLAAFEGFFAARRQNDGLTFLAAKEELFGCLDRLNELYDLADKQLAEATPSTQSAPAPVAQEVPAAPSVVREWRVSGASYLPSVVRAKTEEEAAREFAACHITGGNLCPIGKGIACSDGSTDFIISHPDEGAKCITVEAA